jgi:RNA polymerase sigma-70 factor, ECF subfamily
VGRACDVQADGVKTIGREPDAAELDGLVRRAQAGEARAFDRLGRALLPRIRRWAAAHVESADDADDIAQDVLLKAHRMLSAFAFESRFTTWLYAITRRAAADWHRKRGRRARLQALRLEPAEDAPPSSSTADRQRLTERVLSEFRRLPSRQREVFDLADLQGKSLAEIAEMLAMNPVTVRVHLHRARSAIRSRILQTDAALVEDYR